MSKSKDIGNLLKFLNESPLYYTRDEIEEDKFLWNKYVKNAMNGLENNTGLLYLYNGYFNVKTCTEYEYIIISFISSGRVGPRYFSRGVDSGGNVSNFVKTKYHVLRNEDILIDVIIYRGSVPVYWEQTGSLRELKCNEKDSFRACFKHFYNNFRDMEPSTVKNKAESSLISLLSTNYNNNFNNKAFTRSIQHLNNILVINLLSSKKTEGRLSAIYYELLKEFKIIYMDFNLNKYHMD